LLISFAAYDIFRRSISGLMDQSLPAPEENLIRGIVSDHYRQFIEFHSLRSRKSGSERMIDLHLVLSREMRLEEAHQLCDHLEQDIKRELPRSDVTIHVEPCAGTCDQCRIDCEITAP
jgi:divalent metal cation (Fe/Co/Zn/Cd) transporter